MYDLPAMLRATADRNYPFFLGFAFFEFQVRYDKMGGFGPEVEMQFGLYSLDRTCKIGEIHYFGKDYVAYGLRSRGAVEHAVMRTFGGESPLHPPCKLP